MGRRKALTVPPPADPGVPLDDPEWLAADALLMCAPREWHDELPPHEYLAEPEEV